MQIFFGTFGALLVFTVFWDAFEVIILPRRVNRDFRLNRLFYRVTWHLWAFVFSRAGRRRDSLLGIYGPLSLLVLLAFWAAGLVFGFACLHAAAGSTVADGPGGFFTNIYFSATTFFTLGLGDVSPQGTMARVLTAAEAGMGFGFLGMVLSYLPVMYGSFASREISISLLDARAGSPPSAFELLRRHADGRHGNPVQPAEELRQFLLEWEKWAAELLESHLSYPVLGYYRSQHSNQSWLSALTTILDVCSLSLVGLKGTPERQARMTFAMARHAVIDLCQVFDAPPVAGEKSNRLPESEWKRLANAMKTNGLVITNRKWQQELADLRLLYEPYVTALSCHFRMSLPQWIVVRETHDNWQSTPWKNITGSGVAKLPHSDHF